MNKTKYCHLRASQHKRVNFLLKLRNSSSFLCSQKLQTGKTATLFIYPLMWVTCTQFSIWISCPNLICRNLSCLKTISHQSKMQGGLFAWCNERNIQSLSPSPAFKVSSLGFIWTFCVALYYTLPDLGGVHILRRQHF